MQFVYCQHCQQNIYFRPRTYGDVSIKTSDSTGMLATMNKTFLKIVPLKNLEIRKFCCIFVVEFGNLNRISNYDLFNPCRSFTEVEGIVRVLCVYCPCIVRE